MTYRVKTLGVLACAPLLFVFGCSGADTMDSRSGGGTGGQAGSGQGDPPGGSCQAGARGSCDCGEGPDSGTRFCREGAWDVCNCGSGFGNANVEPGDTGSGSGGGQAPAPMGPTDCDPGTYVGTYSCPLEMNGTDTGWILEGAVQFDLEIDEQVSEQECEVGQEFCFDLVIAEGSGTLFGFVNFFIGFETQLEGGLDCSTGAFQATSVDGIWGLPVPSDPNDPNSPATVSKPPTGMFDGFLEGTHLGGDPQVIDGTWDLTETVYQSRCPGPFRVERMP